MKRRKWKKEKNIKQYCGVLLKSMEEYKKT